ncbi:MAG: hemolysin family protein [Acidimicrobiia bacterium]
MAVAFLVVATAVVVAAEFALVAVDRDRVDALAARGDGRARTAQHLLRSLSTSLAGAQLGITVTSLVLGFIAEPTVARAIEPLLDGVPSGARSGVSIGLALTIVTVATMVLGELIPKGISVARPLGSVLFLARAVRVYGVVFGPLIRSLSSAADHTVRRLGIEPQEELRSIRTIDELELLIRSSGEEGTLDPEAFRLLARTLRFGQRTAGEVLVPRVDLVTVAASASVADLVAVAVSSGHSRFPVVGDGPEDVVGVVYALDALGVPAGRRHEVEVRSILGPATFIPEGRDLESLLTEMRAGGLRLAIVADEYGGVAGIVTLEDMLEEIVGDIEDEHDPAPPVTAPLPPGTFVVEGSLRIDEIREVAGLELPDGPYETVAGFVLDRLGHIPVPGERVVHAGWLVEVLAIERRRISRLRVVEPRATA